MSIGKGLQVKFEDNSSKFNTELKNKKTKITYALGLKWLEICTKLITNKGIVDTGRLRASLSFITPSQSGGNNSFKEEDKIAGRSGEGQLIVGSNLSYASRQELTNRKGSFLEPSITGYKGEYKKVAEMIFKE